MSAQLGAAARRKGFGFSRLECAEADCRARVRILFEGEVVPTQDLKSASHALCLPSEEDSVEPHISAESILIFICVFIRSHSANFGLISPSTDFVV